MEQRLQVFVTEEHPCSYLENRSARTAFVDPEAIITKDLASGLNWQGFRRSGQYLYRSQCNDCSSCQPLRVLVNEFIPSKSQKRNIRKNADLSVEILTINDFDADSREEYFALYERYISERHSKGDMFPPDQDQFDGFIGRLYEFSRIVEFRLKGDLVMVALCDELHDGLSAIYTFFEPSLHSRGLGVYAILWQIRYCIDQQYPYLYLGFWIKECTKMAYKSNYQPNQIYKDGNWQALQN